MTRRKILAFAAFPILAMTSGCKDNEKEKDGGNSSGAKAGCKNNKCDKQSSCKCTGACNCHDKVQCK